MSEFAAYGIPVAVSLRVLKLSCQPYYRLLKQPLTASELGEAYRANALFNAHREHPEFGSRFLVAGDQAAGEAMCKRTASKICRDNQCWSVFGKKRGNNCKRPVSPVHDDLVRRDFTAGRLNLWWLTDITEHWTTKGKLYFRAAKDVCSRLIVGYSIGHRMESRLAVNALVSAGPRRGSVAEFIVHSDRGSQFERGHS